MKKILISGIIVLMIVTACISALYRFLTPDWGFARAVSPEEAALRRQITDTAESWLGTSDRDGSHKPIIDIYNAHEPLAQQYKVTYTDKWCATFGSSVAITCELTQIIPTECGCERQIELFKRLGVWQEDDAYIPLPGDYIFYAGSGESSGDNTGWSDHVGIVIGTWKEQILVIEGNYNGEVKHRIIKYDHPTIRGFGTPNYASLCGINTT